MIGIVVAAGAVAAGFLGNGGFAVGAVILAWCLSAGPREALTRSQRELLLRIVDFSSRAGFVFYYRRYLPGEALALFSLLSAFTEAHVLVAVNSLKVTRIENRLRLTIAACALAAVTALLFERPDPSPAFPILAALGWHCLATHSSALAVLVRLAAAARRRRRPSPNTSGLCGEPVLR